MLIHGLGPAPDLFFDELNINSTSMSLIDIELSSIHSRGILNFYSNGCVEEAAFALRRTKHVMLTTGFNVAVGMPETDGPVGAAALARALVKMGKRVTLVTDTLNQPIVKAAFDVIAAGAQADRILFDAPHDGLDPASAADELLKVCMPDAVFALEVPARTIDGTRRNMRGENIDAFNAHLDFITLQANRRRILTLGVGDGGNETGMGNFFDRIPLAMNGAVMASTVRVGYPITAWNSNLGGEAVAAVVLGEAGRLEELHSPEDQSRMIMAAMQAGAVDGVTRCRSPGAKVEMGGRTHVSGVDGFSLEHHRAQLVSLKTAVARQLATQQYVDLP